MDGSIKTPIKYSDGVKEDLKVGKTASSVQGSEDSRGSCLKRCFIPPDYRHELVQLFKLAGPVIISQLMVFMISFVSTVFCGHLGKTELAGVALSISVVNVTGISIGTVKQSPEVASIAQLYVKIFMPALPAAFMYQLQGRYLQNQGIIWPQVVTGVIANILNAVINYVFLYCLDMGVAGSAAANAISQYLLAVILFTYIGCRGLHKATWGGWTLDCLQEWGPFVRLAIPSMLMLCLEWWIFEIAGFLAGVIILSFFLHLNHPFIIFHFLVFTSSLLIISCTCLPMAVIIACFVGASLSLSRNRVADVMIIFGFVHLADAVAGVAGGVLRGAGKQLIGALCNLVGYYFIGFPIGVSLMFAANMGIVGLWTGLCICVLMQSIFFVIFVCKLDWKKAAEEALVRAGVQIKDENEMVEMKIKDSNQNQYQVSTTASSGEIAEVDHTCQEAHVADQNKSTTTTVGNVLSITQLVLRRGLILLLMVIILVAGIIADIFLTRLLK
ncbi:hypothetical protein FQN60_011610 [Etheostoma spectabile]|uniref:Multidrug and toxin extrusion protein n=1 Tax=Etheostoma spectabile TaxID=54343 RepID=A0A5J5DM72_9PERO|nr:hypothetical protein FQN60_011610 [Etheostoma spectabile]